MNKYTKKKQQAGVVLVISLIMLLLLTLIGVTSMQVTLLEEKMAGNSKDKSVAFEAAEAALRDAEKDIRSTRVSGLSGMTSTCTNGLCYIAGDTLSDIWLDTAQVANAATYGSYTAATPLASVTNQVQPRYLIVGSKFWPPGAASWKYIYTITAMSQGGVSTTQSILEENYAP